jgi:hypothetical protein
LQILWSTGREKIMPDFMPIGFVELDLPWGGMLLAFLAAVVICWMFSKGWIIEPEETCRFCKHEAHKGEQCTAIFVYARGPNDPPGNTGCLCGMTTSELVIMNRGGSRGIYEPR